MSALCTQPTFSGGVNGGLVRPLEKKIKKFFKIFYKYLEIKNTCYIFVVTYKYKQ